MVTAVPQVRDGELGGKHTLGYEMLQPAALHGDSNVLHVLGDDRKSI